MPERRPLDLAACRGGIASGSADRDPANELYDQACAFLEAAQGLRTAAGSRRSAPALAASLGRIEASLVELRDVVRELRDTALTTPADAEPDNGANPWEPAQIRANFALTRSAPISTVINTHRDDHSSASIYVRLYLRATMPTTTLAKPRTDPSNWSEACCPHLTGPRPLARDDAEQLARTLKALADPARLQVLSFLRSRPNAEACACDFVEPLGLAQPTVSHHLKVLYEAGLLERERRATWIYYRLPEDRLPSICQALL